MTRFFKVASRQGCYRHPPPPPPPPGHRDDDENDDDDYYYCDSEEDDYDGPVVTSLPTLTRRHTSDR